jgi:vacuolar-type H+-ATPase subunit H
MAETTHNRTYPQTAGIAPLSHPDSEAMPPSASRPDAAEGHVEQAKAKAHDMANAASEQAKAATHRVGEQMENLADHVRGSAPQEGQIGQAATVVADGLANAGEYLQEANFDDMVKDLTGVVQRYPMQSLLVGVGLGYLLARSTDR